MARRMDSGAAQARLDALEPPVPTSHCYPCIGCRDAARALAAGLAPTSDSQTASRSRGRPALCGEPERLCSSLLRLLLTASARGGLILAQWHWHGGAATGTARK
jgi:hypothetical protein